MNKDLKRIKKAYGENMAKLCRELFPTILETEELLPKIIEKNFSKNHNLYNDLSSNNLINCFKNYIYGIAFKNKRESLEINKTPEQLLSEVGYNLYECKTETDIQKFKRFYTLDEELCTFKGNRLDRCYVYFAVKKDVENIKRTEFPNPERQDLYGTSVISIQFTKDDAHTLSIKNRYNHTVTHPDATFSNNLDNIIYGLTESFAKYYGMKQMHPYNELYIPGYIKANDGKYYKYNYEINNIYYCPNNIIIDDFKPQKCDPNKYLVIDYIIIDLEKNIISTYNNVYDAFPSTIKNIIKISIKKSDNKKEIIITTKEGEAIIGINKCNQIISYKNNFIEEIESDFLYKNEILESIYLPNVKKIDNYFLYNNKSIKEIEFPKLFEIGSNFLRNNTNIENISMPSLKYAGNSFLIKNEHLEELSLPSLEKTGDFFLKRAKNIKSLKLDNLKKVGRYFLTFNNTIKELSLPNLEEVGNDFLTNNKSIENLFLPKIRKIGDYCLIVNNCLEELDLSNAEEIGNDFLECNNHVNVIFSSKLKSIGNSSLKHNKYTKINKSNKKQFLIKKLKKILKK